MRLVQRLLWVVVCLLILASPALAAEGGAVATSNARAAASAQAAANLGGGGNAGYDLRAIASPKKPQTLTGFPAGTLPGDGLGGDGSGPDMAGKAVPSDGSLGWLPPYIGDGMIGATLDHVFSVASHVGYTVVRRADMAGSLDAFYTFDVLRGRSRQARVYFDRSLKVLRVENYQRPVALNPSGALPLSASPASMFTAAVPLSGLSQSITVYYTDTGEKYHLDGCVSLRRSKHAISLEDARRRFEPCEICKPPR